MGLSVSVVMATDEQINQFVNNPRALDSMLSQIIPYSGSDKCYLADYWEWLHYLLAGTTNRSGPPLGAIKSGDVKFKRVSDPTHAIYAATTRVLAEGLQGLTEPALRERVNRKSKSGGSVYPGRYLDGQTADEEPESFREMLFYLGRFREFAAAATSQDKGLIFCRYEDW